MLSWVTTGPAHTLSHAPSPSLHIPQSLLELWPRYGVPATVKESRYWANKVRAFTSPPQWPPPPPATPTPTTAGKFRQGETKRGGDDKAPGQLEGYSYHK